MPAYFNDDLHTLTYKLARGIGDISANPTYDADAQAYFNSVIANGGTLSSPSYNEAMTKSKLNAAFVAMKSAGLWNSLVDWGIFCGVGNLNGALVKAKNTTGAPLLTNNNFVAGDYAPTGASLGIKGSALGYLSTGIDNSAIPQNDCSLGVYATEPSQAGVVQALIGNNATTIGSFNFIKSSVGGFSIRIKSSGSTVGTMTSGSRGFIGATRSDNANFRYIFPGSAIGSVAAASGASTAGGISVFARGAGDSPTLSRISSYFIGANLDLVAIKTVLDNLAVSFGYAP